MENLGDISHFSRAFKENTAKLSLNGWEALNYILLDKKILVSYKSIWRKLENNAF